MHKVSKQTLVGALLWIVCLKSTTTNGQQVGGFQWLSANPKIFRNTVRDCKNNILKKSNFENFLLYQISLDTTTLITGLFE